ncbi:hypothetical protein SPONL_2060 [uncultured Candidatus Thioglobus sp.]|nr:hypothetical protein SPONL_2060 [uncultured Candidatus Thioglobus sp.]
MSNDKKTTLGDINKNMESIRKLTEQSRKLTEPYKKILDANPTVQSQTDLVSKFPKLGESIEKFNVFKPNKIIIGNALKNNGYESIKRTIPKVDISSMDYRSRAEQKEDFETKILEIDQKKIRLLVDVWKKIENNKEIKLLEVKDLEESTINTLIKYQRTISTFEVLNSDLAVQLDYKKNELKFIAMADWKNKFRLFFFRILWTILFVGSLFVVGYIEKEYEWANLPMSKYFYSKNIDIKK